MQRARRFRPTEIVLGAFCTGLGLFLVIEVWRAPPIAAKAVVGPGAFPTVIAVALLAVGLRLFQEAWLNRREDDDLPELDLRSFMQGAAAFGLMVAALEWLGWVLAGTAMFMAVARAFGDRRPWRTLALGVALTSLMFLVFDHALDLSLPVGALFEPFLDPQDMP